MARSLLSLRAMELHEEGSSNRPVVLVVEDDLETQSFMRLLLRRNWRVRVAASAEEVRKRLAADPIEIILMDLSLRGEEDGLALTRWLRKQASWRSLPIIAVTAHAFDEDRQNALAAGCDRYLSKPIDRKHLEGVMSELLGASTP